MKTLNPATDSRAAASLVAARPPLAAPTLFRAHCPARQLYVLVRARPGPRFTLAQMDAVAQDQWQLSLTLPPGTYCYRYLAELDGAAAYVSPVDAEETPPTMRRFDAVLTVRATD